MNNKALQYDTTVLFPVLNEGAYLSEALKHFTELGFTKILVVDDVSTDNTYDIAIKNNASVIRNVQRLGYDLSLLRGLYNIERGPVLIIYDTEYSTKSHAYEEFISFGILGNYSMLLQKDDSIYSKKFARALRNRFGIFMECPSFNLVFINNLMLDKIKLECPGGSVRVIYEFFRIAINNKLKIGTYPLNAPEYKPATFIEKRRYKKGSIVRGILITIL